MILSSDSTRRVEISSIIVGIMIMFVLFCGNEVRAMNIGDGLMINPAYEKYLDDVAMGKGDEWVIVPKKFVQKDGGRHSLWNVTASGALPSAYSLVENGYGTPIKDQGSDGTCWAYALTTAMESNLWKTQGIRVDLSPKQLDYLTSTGTPYSQQIVRVFGEGGERAVGSGGSSLLAGFAFGGEYAPIDEDSFYPIMRENDPNLSFFDTFEEYQDYIRIVFMNVAAEYGYGISIPYDNALSVADIMSKKANYVVSDYTGLSTKKSDIDDVKSSVMENGAVYVGTVGPGTTNCWDEATKTIIDKGSNVCGKVNGHAMAIVGWDDEHAYTDPSTGQSGRGAFILQNSWGKSNLFENVNIDMVIEVLKAQEWFDESLLTEENYQKVLAMVANYDAYEYVYLAYDWEDSSDKDASIDFVTINLMEENTYDKIYDILDVEGEEGGILTGDNMNEVVFSYDVDGDGKEKIDWIAVNDHDVIVNYDVTLSIYVDDGDGYVEFGSAMLSAGTFGKRKITTSGNVEVSGTFDVKMVATVDGEPLPLLMKAQDGENYTSAAKYFTTSVYTNKVPDGEDPGGDPDPGPGPDIPDPEDPDDPDVPGTGLFTHGVEGVLGVMSCLVILCGFGFVIYQVYINRKNVFHKIKFDKKQ